MSPRRLSRLLLIASFAGLSLLALALERPTLADPPFWDENCYVPQSRFIAAHGLDLPAYRALGFVRPPVFTTLLASLIRAGASSITWLRLATCLVGTLLLPLTWLLARRLGGSARAAWIAVGMVALSPLFVAQIGLVESDAPTTVLVVAAWILLLGGRTGWFMVVSAIAVLTKESAYFLCAPAAVLLFLRSGRRVWAVWPAAVPGLALFAWLGIHRLVIGVAIPPVNHAALGPNHLPDAMLHAWIEGGRFLLLPLAISALVRPRPEWDRAGMWATLAGIAALPLLFPGPLPRYMMPTLPFLAAMAALAVDRAALRVRATALAAVAVVLALGWWRTSWHTPGGHHMDASLGYREALADERQVAAAVAGAHPRRVLATFPMAFAFSSGPEDHYLPAPVPTTVAADQPLAELCGYDFLVEAAQGNPAEPAASRLRAAGALRPFLEVGPPERRIRAERIACAP